MNYKGTDDKYMTSILHSFNSKWSSLQTNLVLNIKYLGLPRCFGQVHEHLSDLSVKDPHPAPVQSQWGILSFEHLTSTPKHICEDPGWENDHEVGAKQGIYLCLEDPVSLWFKRLDLIVTFNTEAKCWSLARPKRDQGRIQIAIFALKILSLKPEDI